MWNMRIHLLKSKLHKAEVSGASLNYEGSITIDEDLMDRSGLARYERVLCGNMSNGARFETYVIPGPRGSGAIELNGATARLGQRGDLLTIMAFADVEADQAQDWKPRILLLGAPGNQVLRESEK